MTYAILLTEIAFVGSVLLFGVPASSIGSRHEALASLPQSVSNSPSHPTIPAKLHCRFYFGCAPTADSTRTE
jgi:hypothetical protein